MRVLSGHRPAAVAAAIIAAFSLLASPGRAEVRYYNCVLNPRQVVPPVTGSRATGAGRFVIDTDANTVSYWIVFTKLSSAETVAHIHGNFISSPGINADIRVTLPPGNPKVGTWTYTEDLEATILNGFAYADIHTAGAAGGELRGQIVPFNAVLDGVQETAGAATAGTGWATFTIDKIGHQLTYYIAYAGLSGPVTAAHFHGPALHGQSAAITLPITIGASPLKGTVSYAVADEPAILAGRWYVNLHTAANPDGEIRGQVCPVVVPMDATQEVPPVAEPGSAGFGLVAIDTLANVISYDVHVDSVRIASTAVHLHGFAPVTGNAGVLVSLLPGARRIGSWTYGAANEHEMLLDHAYFDVHTSTHANGEIRGQLLRLPGSNPLLSVGGPPRAIGGLAAAPNPFLAGTRLSFRLFRAGEVSLRVVSVDGRVVRRIDSGWLDTGPHALEWDGHDDGGRALAPGLYFACVRSADGETVTKLARLH
jgi:hypothetical protein